MARAFRLFTRTDWWGYSGAEPLPDGTGPRILEDVPYRSPEAEDVATATFLICGDPDRPENVEVSADVFLDRMGERREWWALTLPGVEVARRFGALIPDTVGPVTLRALGFRRID